MTKAFDDNDADKIISEWTRAFLLRNGHLPAFPATFERGSFVFRGHDKRIVGRASAEAMREAIADLSRPASEEIQ